MNSATEKQLLLELHHECIESATTITALRARLNQLEVVTNEVALAAAEQEPAAAALEEVTAYVEERLRVEREALKEPGVWGMTVPGSAIGHTLYHDLVTKLYAIRKSYGV